MGWSRAKKFVYSITAVIILIECLFVEAIISNWVVAVLAIIGNCNLGYALWVLDREDDDYGDY